MKKYSLYIFTFLLIFIAISITLLLVVIPLGTVGFPIFYFEVSQVILTILAIVLLIILIVIFIILYESINPLRKIILACREVRKGNLDVDVEIKQGNEVGNLAETFNKMIKDLKKNRKELSKSKNILEVKIEDKTKELKELTKSLDLKVGKRTIELENSRKSLLNILEDVKEAKEKEKEEKNKTLAIITNFTDGLLVFDNKNNLILINPQARQFFEIENENIIGKSFSKLSEFPIFEDLIKITGEKMKEAFKKEFQAKEKLVLEVSVVFIKKEKEKIGSLMILHDITREKIIEKLKTEFVSISAHQLRTPLSAIKWSLSLLKEETSKKEREDLLNKIYSSNERMIRLINDLLNVTRIEEGRYIHKLESKDMVELVEKMIRFKIEQAERKRVKLKFKKPKEKIPEVKIDEEKISLCLQNLIENAIHYSFCDEEVTISVKYDKKRKAILFSIKDTGAGILKNQKERIFTKFFRGENVVKMETEGTGLGLFITKNIIESHRGEIWFESEEKKGSTFYFTLPIN